MIYLLLFQLALSALLPLYASSPLPIKARDLRVQKIRENLPAVFNALGVQKTEAVLQIYDLLSKHRTRESERGAESMYLCNGRLTLTSGTAITTSDVTAASTVYFTPYKGAKIALYSGTVWETIAFSEASVAVPSTTSTPFDIFGYNNGGTLTLEALSWSSDTARATALTLQNGVYVKSGATTRRYLGTGRTTTASGQTEDSLTKRFLWNQCNRTRKPMKANPAGAWSYGTTTWRSSGADTTFRLQFVVGLNEVPVYASHVANTSGTCDRQTGICLDNTNANSAPKAGYNGINDSDYTTAATTYLDFVGVGYHFLQAVEYVYSCSVIYAQSLQTLIGDIEC